LSPILVRPVREQLEHDRVIRLLQAKYKRKFEVAVNPGNTQAAPVGTGVSAWYPDLVLQSSERGRKLLGVVEVETSESVNQMEAMSQWAAFSRLRAPFHLYVPSSSIDTARRLCADLQITVAEMWAYATLGDQVRFTLVHRTGGAPADTKPRPQNGQARPAAVRGAVRDRAAGPARKTSARPRAAAKTVVRRAAAARKTSSGRAQKRK
jgi:hypothetical protein